jgi:cytoskeleton protein RodZ
LALAGSGFNHAAVFDEMKRFRAVEPPAVDAARLGEELREARLALGASVEDMAAQLRIRRVYLVALEEGRLKDLPAPAYAIGFVRNYAGALGLDVNDMVRRFREVALGIAPRGGELVFPEPVPDRGFPTGVLVLAGLAVAVGSYIAWYNWSGSEPRVVDAVPAVPARLDPAVREGEALRPGPTPPAAPAATPAPGLSASIPVPTPVPVQVPAAAPPAPAPPPAEGRMALRFRGEAWTQVRDARNNEVLLNRTMRAGESWDVPMNRPGLLLSTGAAQNMDLLVDGTPSPVFAQFRGVRRDLALNAAELRGPPPAAPRPAAPPAAPATTAPPPPAAAPPAPARLSPPPAQQTAPRPQ